MCKNIKAINEHKKRGLRRKLQIIEEASEIDSSIIDKAIKNGNLNIDNKLNIVYNMV